MLKCEGLTKKYNKNIVVNNLSFHVREKEVFALLGSNGAGKTTTIKMILGLVKPTAGRIYRDEGVSIAYSPETPYFHGFLSAVEVMDFFSKLQRIPKRSKNNQIEIILKQVGLWDNREKKVRNYSKGMLQRLAIAQSLLGNPDILLLDEPSAGLDAVGRVHILNLIKELKEKGKTIILNSHILGDVQRVADRGIIIDKGKIMKEWTADELQDHTSLENIFLDIINQ
ncbi:ABC transporter ATP-binding protein [Clostridiaceae bacterium M8S5]|nr:ABC transporter ATP-binding protein [Clostridiaceae bacterium M8S5]